MPPGYSADSGGPRPTPENKAILTCVRILTAQLRGIIRHSMNSDYHGMTSTELSRESVIRLGQGDGEVDLGRLKYVRQLLGKFRSDITVYQVRCNFLGKPDLADDPVIGVAPAISKLNAQEHAAAGRLLHVKPAHGHLDQAQAAQSGKSVLGACVQVGADELEPLFFRQPVFALCALDHVMIFRSRVPRE